MDPRLLLVYPSLLFLFIFVCLSPTSDAFPVASHRSRQYLPPMPGYIPVYIQDGETPPDVESLSETVDQSPTQDKMDTDVEEVPQKSEPEPEDALEDADSGLRALRESEEFIVQQLTDNVRDNDVRGLAEEVHGPKP